MSLKIAIFYIFSQHTALKDTQMLSLHFAYWYNAKPYNIFFYALNKDLHETEMTSHKMKGVTGPSMSLQIPIIQVNHCEILWNDF